MNFKKYSPNGPNTLAKASLVTRAGRHGVLKSVFRIIICFCFFGGWGSTFGLTLVGSRPGDKFFVVSRTV